MKLTSIILFTIIMALLTGCSQASKPKKNSSVNAVKSGSVGQKAVASAPASQTFAIQRSNSGLHQTLSDLRKAGDDYQGYTISNKGVQIAVYDLSVAILNNMKTFMEGQNGTIFEKSLSQAELGKVKLTLLNETVSHLQGYFKVSDTARYRILILLHGGDSINFDSYQNASGEMDIHLLLMDTKTKIILWHSDKALGQGRDPEEAANNASSSIDQQLDALFAKKKL